MVYVVIYGTRFHCDVYIHRQGLWIFLGNTEIERTLSRFTQKEEKATTSKREAATSAYRTTSLFRTAVVKWHRRETWERASSNRAGLRLRTANIFQRIAVHLTPDANLCQHRAVAAARRQSAQYGISRFSAYTPDLNLLSISHLNFRQDFGPAEGSQTNSLIVWMDYIRRFAELSRRCANADEMPRLADTCQTLTSVTTSW